MAAMQEQKHLPDAILAEVWTVMHLAVASDVSQSGRNNADFKVIETAGGHPVGDFIAEGAVEEMEDDGPFDGNANVTSVEDMEALRETAHQLVNIGDNYTQAKEEEDKLINDIVNCLQDRASNITVKLEKDLSSPIPSSGIFEESLVNVAYSEVSSRLKKFLVGSEGFNKIAVVTHITKGVSAALRNVSAPAVHLAAALSYKFVTDNYANLILQSGGLSSMVTSNSQGQK